MSEIKVIDKIQRFYDGDILIKEKTLWHLESDEPKESLKGEILNSPKFDDLVYSEKQKEFMKLVLNKLKIERLHLLLSGPAGTGKTYSAKMLACELKKPFIYLNGQMSPKRIAETIINAEKNSLILIDEIHNLPDKVSETIYPAIEYDEISQNGKMIRLKNNVIFIGTTTEPEMLPKPLLDRLFRVEFDEPDEELAKQILLKMNVNEDIAHKLLNHTLNIRILKKLIKIMQMYGEVNGENLTKLFRMMKINVYSGLSDIQDKYIEYLKKIKIASLRNLSLVLRMSENQIKYEIETELIRKGLIVITSKGRSLNPEISSYTYEEIEKAKQKIDEAPKFKQDSRELARIYLQNHPELKEKFSKRIFELINFMSEKIEQGIEPDLVDISSFGNDKQINESYKDNYLEEL